MDLVTVTPQSNLNRDRNRSSSLDFLPGYLRRLPEGIRKFSLSAIMSTVWTRLWYSTIGTMAVDVNPLLLLSVSRS